MEPGFTEILPYLLELLALLSLLFLSSYLCLSLLTFAAFCMSAAVAGVVREHCVATIPNGRHARPSFTTALCKVMPLQHFLAFHCCSCCPFNAANRLREAVCWSCISCACFVFCTLLNISARHHGTSSKLFPGFQWSYAVIFHSTFSGLFASCYQTAYIITHPTLCILCVTTNNKDIYVNLLYLINWTILQLLPDSRKIFKIHFSDTFT